MSIRALMIVGDGFEEIEAIAIVDILRRAKIKVTIAAIDFKLVTGKHEIMIKSDCLLEKVKDLPYEFDILLLPGGITSVNSTIESKEALKIIKNFAKNKKRIAAICAAPKILNHLGLIKNKKVTSHPSIKDELTQSTYLEESVVIDENLITSRGPGTAMDLGFILVELLKNKEEATKLKVAMVAE